MGCLGLNEWLRLVDEELVEMGVITQLEGLTKQAKSIVD